MKITLTMICFREEAVIERCLNSFAPAFDELCLVVATGAAKRDETLELAQEWCRANGKSFSATFYWNQADRSDWQHTDDFAAARNLSLKLAREGSADWWFWADADDTISPEHAQRIREIAEQEQAKPEAERVTAWFADYYAPQPVQAVTFQRERLMHKSVTGNWIRPVHERFVVEHARKGHMGEVLWLHQPLEQKERDPQRNLRILRAHYGSAGENAWDISREASILHAHGDGEEFGAIADRYGRIALADPRLQKDARTETLARMAVTAQDITEAKSFAWDAIRFDPERRDGYIALAEIELSDRQPFRALTFAELASTLRQPPPTGVPMHNLAYGWYGADVLMRAYRACAARTGNRGYLEKADKLAAGLHAKARAEGRPVISVLHATMRPEQAIKARNRWLAAASDASRIEWIFGCEDNDDHALKVLWQHKVVWSPERSCVGAWNLAAHAASGEIFIQMSDDWMPCAGWDELIATALPMDKPAVLAISDGARTDDLMCMAILNRWRWEQQECELFSGEYSGMYSDNEYTLRAYADKVVTERKDIVFKHLHPVHGTAPTDAVYEKQNAPEEYEKGRAIFLRRNKHLLKS